MSFLPLPIIVESMRCLTVCALTAIIFLAQVRGMKSIYGRAAFTRRSKRCASYMPHSRKSRSG